MTNDLHKIDRSLVNNAYYDTDACAWSNPAGPLALLHAEGKIKNKWILETLEQRGLQKKSVLDVGCGGGYLTNFLAERGFKVTGVDLSGPSLDHARLQDQTRSVNYKQADAYNLPFADQSFDVVTCLDFLEHVSKPELVIQEAARVLKPNGLFVYHTFDRNILSYIIVVKGVEWFVKGTPEKLHVYELLIKPKELSVMMKSAGLSAFEERGLRPRLDRYFLRLLLTRKIEPGFGFTWTKSKAISYMGMATRL